MCLFLVFLTPEIAAQAPAEPLNRFGSTAFPSAYLFNLTQQQITQISIGSVTPGPKFLPLKTGELPIKEGEVWPIGPALQTQTTALVGNSITVKFENGKSWTQTINIGSNTLKQDISVWLFTNGAVVSTLTGELENVAWASQ